MEIMTILREQWDRAAALAAVVAGGALLVLGWVGISDRIYPGEQIPYVVSGGLGGLFLLGIGSVLWISADLRDEWRKLDTLEASVRSIETHLADAAIMITRTGQSPPADTELVDLTVRQSG